MQLDASQEAAVAMALREPISAITGGPGTGKTTIIKTLLERFTGRDVALCAPTGKAAKRMQEATGREAKTIHRLLAYSPVDGFWFGASDKLPHDVVICDETSMVDTELMSWLLRACDERRTQLILVGDFNQLPSVGPGAVLGDLVRSDLIPVSRLTQVHRSAQGSWVCDNAPRILKGEPLPLMTRKDFRFVEVENASNIAKFVGDEIDNVTARTNGEHDLQVLSPQSTQSAGTDALNKALQARFNPMRGIQWENSAKILRVGDKVIHTKNDYDLGVFNGECGVIEDMNHKHCFVGFPDKSYPVEYTKDQARALKLAYALTIHKSQGSEWPWVAVIVHSSQTFMLTRQLLYTAVTRGKQGVVIIGNKKGVEAALKGKKDKRRNTALVARITGEL